ncbi:MAG TPA: M28 family metallopeptidase [Archangium sp.]|jgi:Zn-dependent M28 family amino/carboxypeptidase|uniref:M28 family metallopeptidase n=1 Tax=Archangium sp. TaxID=1872627 RepID=UPI002ED9DF2E
MIPFRSLAVIALLMTTAVSCKTPGNGAALRSAAAERTRDEELVRGYLQKLASFGERAVGSEAGRKAAEWLRDEMESIGLENPHFEEFAFPYNEYRTGKLSIQGGGLDRELAYDVLEASGGTGGKDLTAELVWVNIGAPADLAGKDLSGKIGVLKRDLNYDRAVQILNLINAHAAGMLYISNAPNNLRQLGTVRKTFEATHSIPAVSIGQEDGEVLVAALDAGKTLRATLRLDVTASTLEHPGHGRNVVGRITGEDADKVIIIGAHYDTWKTGAVDNTSGAASVLAIARREVERFRASGKKPRYTLVFTELDGEENALYGGYDYLRKHYFVPNRETIIAVINLEMPVGADKETQAKYPESAAPTWSIAYSQIKVLNRALKTVNARQAKTVYPVLQGFDNLVKLAGGTLATDIQPHYRAGIPTICTWTDTPWYHTSLDDLDHIDVEALGRAVGFFNQLLAELAAHAPEEFTETEAGLLKAKITTVPRRSNADDLMVDVELTDAQGRPAADVALQAEYHVSDYFQAWSDYSGATRTDASGHARIVVPAAKVELAPTGRYLNVTAGNEYPLVEAMAPVEDRR